MNSVLKYIGKMKNIHLCEYIDMNKYSLYVEPFAGSFNCGFNIIEDGYTGRCILNDKDGLIKNFWECVKEEPLKLYGTILKEHEQLSSNKVDLSKLASDKDNYKRAAYQYIYSQYNNINNLKNSGTIHLDISNIIQCSNMLHNVKILNLDFKDVIQEYDSNKTLFLIDPPYNISRIDKYYRCNSSEFNHEALRKLIDNIKGDWIIRYNDNKYTNMLYNNIEKLFETNKVLFGKQYKEIYYTNILR